MSTSDGGPAFPVLENVEQYNPHTETYQTVLQSQGGMSLRDYFAIRAPEPTPEYINTQGESDRLANPHNDSYKPKRRNRFEIIAAYKYAYADAMLLERSK